MAKTKLTKKQEKINEKINKLKEAELAKVESLKKSVSDCVDHLCNKKAFYLICIGSDNLDDKLILPCYVSNISISNSKSIYLTVDFILDESNRTMTAPFYDIREINMSDKSIFVGICKTENDCKKIYNHFLDLEVKRINSHRMKIS